MKHFQMNEIVKCQFNDPIIFLWVLYLYVK